MKLGDVALMMEAVYGHLKPRQTSTKVREAISRTTAIFFHKASSNLDTELTE
jgi:hypothetical protein